MEKRQSIEVRAAMLAASQASESKKAQELIDQFVAQAQAANLPSVALRARTLDGHAVRTNLRGWYLRNDHSAAVSVQGRYYQLLVPAGLQTRLFGAQPQPSAPPLVLGRGGKDGEAIDLKDALARALAGQVA